MIISDRKMCQRVGFPRMDQDPVTYLHYVCVVIQYSYLYYVCAHVCVCMY